MCKYDALVFGLLFLVGNVVWEYGVTRYSRYVSVLSANVHLLLVMNKVMDFMLI